MFNRKNLTEKERVDILEYLAFQTKTGMSFKAALTRYLDSDRVSRIVEIVETVISAIEAGIKPADALLEGKVVSEIDFTLIANAQNPSEAIAVVVLLSKSRNKSADVLKSSIRSGLLMLGGLLMLIPFFREDIEQIYMMFATMSTMTSGVAPEAQIPFLVKYWWSTFVVIGLFGALYFAVAEMIKWMYRYYGNLYYRVFGYTIYRDLVFILTSLSQMGRTMSWAQAYATLSHSAPNSYWGELFGDIAENLKQGGKASGVIALQRGIIPVEVIQCFTDGEDTGEVNIYLQKAVVLCQERFDKAQEQIRASVPIFFDLLLYFLVGLVAVKFTEDMNNLGIMQVLTQIK
ncbi:MAG: hypothetical protein WCW84_06845 [Sulfurimonas sp.]|jgi:type II secretory pathway component PulF